MKVAPQVMGRRLSFCLGLGLIALIGGCGAGLGDQGLPEEQILATTAASTSTSSRTTAGPSLTTGIDDNTTATAPIDGLEAFPAAFVTMAQGLAPVPVYGWSKIPEGLTIASEWWPVTDCLIPEEYQGPVRTNPWINQDPFEPEAQLVLVTARGWLVILENFRGDLGDVSGREVGRVGDAVAMIYEVNSGYLVQWSHEGRWYGVFGRGVAADFVIDTALLLQLILL